jgi:hypothetical protein
MADECKKLLEDIANDVTDFREILERYASELRNIADQLRSCSDDIRDEAMICSDKNIDTIKSFIESSGVKTIAKDSKSKKYYISENDVIEVQKIRLLNESLRSSTYKLMDDI